MTDDHLDRLRAWRRQLNTDHRAWYERNGHPVPEPLHPADEEVPCRLGCGTDLTGPGGEHLPLLLADLDAVLDELEWARAEDARTEKPSPHSDDRIINDLLFRARRCDSNAVGWDYPGVSDEAKRRRYEAKRYRQLVAVAREVWAAADAKEHDAALQQPECQDSEGPA